MLKIFLKVLCLAILVVGCTEDSNPNPTDNSSIVIIENFSFLPEELTVEAGETVFFVNEDGAPHQILSQSDADLFDDTGEFSSEMIAAGETGFVVVPETAATGDVFYYYCDVLQDGMATPNGSLLVE